MVQLRDDILDEVTKACFEWLRVKMELDGLSVIDTNKKAEKELRLPERFNRLPLEEKAIGYLRTKTVVIPRKILRVLRERNKLFPK